MNYFEQDELALLLLMNDQKGTVELVQDSGPELLAGLLEEEASWGSCLLAPGRGHLPAEIGGRIAESAPEPASRPARRGDWLRQFDAGYCISDLVPLQFDRKTFIYTGTIFWQTPNQGASINT